MNVLFCESINQGWCAIPNTMNEFTFNHVIQHNLKEQRVELVMEVNAFTNGPIGFILIEPDGGLIQLARLDRSVAHAGKAQWNGKSPNRCHLSFCLLNWGWLEQHGEDFKSWAGAFVLGDNAKTGKDITGKKRFWHSATPEQFNSLVRISKWAMAHGISPDDVCGHDEAALPLGRKLDPGGVLPCSMGDFRELLRNEKENSEKPEISSIH